MKQFSQITDQYLFYQFFSKIIERLMYHRLIEFINENGLLYEYQFGFQRGKSTSMALVTLIDKVTEALDKGECIILYRMLTIFACYVLTFMFGMLFLLLTTSLGCFCPRILLFE